VAVGGFEICPASTRTLDTRIVVFISGWTFSQVQALRDATRLEWPPGLTMTAPDHPLDILSKPTSLLAGELRYKTRRVTDIACLGGPRATIRHQGPHDEVWRRKLARLVLGLT
jgi:hypothetical protein